MQAECSSFSIASIVGRARCVTSSSVYGPRRLMKRDVHDREQRADENQAGDHRDQQLGKREPALSAHVAQPVSSASQHGLELVEAAAMLMRRKNRRRRDTRVRDAGDGLLTPGRGSGLVVDAEREIAGDAGYVRRRVSPGGIARKRRGKDQSVSVGGVGARGRNRRPHIGTGSVGVGDLDVERRGVARNRRFDGGFADGRGHCRARSNCRDVNPRRRRERLLGRALARPHLVVAGVAVRGALQRREWEEVCCRGRNRGAALSDDQRSDIRRSDPGGGDRRADARRRAVSVLVDVAGSRHADVVVPWCHAREHEAAVRVGRPRRGARPGRVDPHARQRVDTGLIVDLDPEASVNRAPDDRLVGYGARGLPGDRGGGLEIGGTAGAAAGRPAGALKRRVRGDGVGIPIELDRPGLAEALELLVRQAL